MQEKSFLEVLIDQILAENSAQNSVSETSSRQRTPSYEWDSSPAYLAYLLAHPPTSQQKNSAFGRKNPYFSKAGRRPNFQQRDFHPTLSETFTSEKQSSPHGNQENQQTFQETKNRSFSIPQQQALLFFHMHQFPLPMNFEGNDLKKAYRKLAQKLHPDRYQDGSHQAFLALQRAYEILQKTL